MKKVDEFKKRLMEDEALSAKVKEALMEYGAEHPGSSEQEAFLAVAERFDAGLTPAERDRELADAEELDEDRLELISGGEKECVLDWSCDMILKHRGIDDVRYDEHCFYDHICDAIAVGRI